MTLTMHSSSVFIAMLDCITQPCTVDFVTPCCKDDDDDDDVSHKVFSDEFVVYYKIL